MICKRDRRFTSMYACAPSAAEPRCLPALRWLCWSLCCGNFVDRALRWLRQAHWRHDGSLEHAGSVGGGRCAVIAAEVAALRWPRRPLRCDDVDDRCTVTASAVALCDGLHWRGARHRCALRCKSQGGCSGKGHKVVDSRCAAMTLTPPRCL